MKRLNIAMNRNFSTTHRSRWVVSVAILFVVFLIVFIHTIIQSFLFSSSIKEIPVDTVIGIRLFLLKKNENFLQKTFENIPLIQENGLTLHHLISEIDRDFHVIIHENQTTSVIIQTKNISKIDPVLDSLHLTKKLVGKNTYLISKSLVATKPYKPQFFIQNPFYSINLLGEWFIPINKKRNKIVKKENHIYTKIPHLQKIEFPKITQIPEGTVAYSSFSTLFSHKNISVLQTYGIFSTEQLELAQNILKPFVVFLSKKNEKIYFVEYFYNKVSIESYEFLLKHLASATKPFIKKRKLTDESEILEIQIDPEIYPVEKQYVQGKSIFRVRLDEQEEYFLGISEKNSGVFTNQKTLLSFDPFEKSKKINNICFGSVFGINIKQTEQFQNNGIYKPVLFYELLKKFHSLGIEQKKKNFVFHLCE